MFDWFRKYFHLDGKSDDGNRHLHFVRDLSARAESGEFEYFGLKVMELPIVAFDGTEVEPSERPICFLRPSPVSGQTQLTSRNGLNVNYNDGTLTTDRGRYIGSVNDEGQFIDRAGMNWGGSNLWYHLDKEIEEFQGFRDAAAVAGIVI